VVRIEPAPWGLPGATWRLAHSHQLMSDIVQIEPAGLALALSADGAPVREGSLVLYTQNAGPGRERAYTYRELAGAPWSLFPRGARALGFCRTKQNTTPNGSPGILLNLLEVSSQIGCT
jgi:hypothetical protein